MKGARLMIKKIKKEIQRLEQQKELKLSQKSKLELDISSKLKELNLLKNQYEKFEQGANNFFNPQDNIETF